MRRRLAPLSLTQDTNPLPQDDSEVFQACQTAFTNTVFLLCKVLLWQVRSREEGSPHIMRRYLNIIKSEQDGLIRLKIGNSNITIHSSDKDCAKTATILLGVTERFRLVFICFNQKSGNFITEAREFLSFTEDLTTTREQSTGVSSDFANKLAQKLLHYNVCEIILAGVRMKEASYEEAESIGEGVMTLYEEEVLKTTAYNIETPATPILNIENLKDFGQGRPVLHLQTQPSLPLKESLGSPEIALY